MSPEVASVTAEVWGALYELEHGERFLVPTLCDQFRQDHKTIMRLVCRAEQAGLVRLVEKPGRNTAGTWERLALPIPTTIEWAISRGANRQVAWRVYEVLTAEKYLLLTSAGFVPRK